MSQEWIMATIAQMTESRDPDIRKTATVIMDNPDKWVLRGHVLDANGVNRWGPATETVRRV